MKSVLLLLDDVPADGQAGPASDWFARIECSLGDDPGDWLAAIGRFGQMSDEHAWSLLSCIEVAASQIVRTRSPNDLVTSAFAMGLVLQSALDRRDCAIVASLLRRASTLADLDFKASVTEGCSRAGVIGQEARDLLLHAPADLPSTHVETGTGATFAFMRVEPGFDVDDLERWLEGDEGP